MQSSIKPCGVLTLQNGLKCRTTSIYGGYGVGGSCPPHFKRLQKTSKISKEKNPKKFCKIFKDLKEFFSLWWWLLKSF